MFGKLLMRFDRVGGDTNNFGARSRVVFPAISDRAHLPSTDRSFISRIEEQDNNLATRVLQTPHFAIAVLETEIRRRRADLGVILFGHFLPLKLISHRLTQIPLI